MDSRTIIRLLQAEGWELARIKGSHHHFKHPERPGIATVPHPRKDVKLRTVRSIELQSGVALRGRG
jgi:predicted RNA binding protein YcfA (HicA-like mRNA interferase family)